MNKFEMFVNLLHHRILDGTSRGVQQTAGVELDYTVKFCLYGKDLLVVTFYPTAHLNLVKYIRGYCRTTLAAQIKDEFGLDSLWFASEDDVTCNPQGVIVPSKNALVPKDCFIEQVIEIC